ncbi:MAG: hypothetical protein ACTSV3_00450 [Candidatus Thorarchaeota archaeon]|nr:MAG: hypothetical protein DRO87_10260 [Candidatus Thorarchaeota archaeon]RLI56791.1 MAG: hypothetical protein DRP09_05450 [Candidatus Thorarchaeota archaeon]
MSTEGDQESILKCVFCGKRISADEAVRYRGALACRECALAQEKTKQFNERPYSILAGIGCVIVIPTILLMTMHGLMYAPTPGYVPPLMIFLGGFAISLPLQAAGLFALNRVELPRVAIITVIVALLTTVSMALAVYDLAANGPTYVVESIVYVKQLTYYSDTMGLYILFCLVAAIGVLLGYSRTRMDNPAIAAGGGYLIASGINIFHPVLPTVGFVHVAIYAILFVFFMTREDIVDPEARTTVAYEPLDK